MKKIIFLVAFLFVGIASAQQQNYMELGGNGFAGYGLTTSGTGSNVGFVFNNGADTWGLGYGSSIQGAGTSVLTWTTTRVGVMTTSPSYTLDVTGTARITGAIVGSISTATYATTALNQSGGTVSATSVNITGSGQLLLGNATSAQIAAITPGQAHGATIFNSTIDAVCYSTAIAPGAWILPKISTAAASVSCWQ